MKSPDAREAVFSMSAILGLVGNIRLDKSTIRYSIVDFYYISHFSSVGRAIVL